MQYFAEPTAATLKGCGCALQQNLDKATKDKKQNFSDPVFVWLSEVHALSFGFTPVSAAWESLV